MKEHLFPIVGQAEPKTLRAGEIAYCGFEQVKTRKSRSLKQLTKSVICGECFVKHTQKGIPVYFHP